MDAQYVANIFTVLEPGMDCIWRHGAADIQVQSPVGSKHKRENLRQDSGYSKRRYGKPRYQVGALQGGVSENMEQLPRR